MESSGDGYGRRGRGWHGNRGQRGHRHYGRGQRRGQGSYRGEEYKGDGYGGRQRDRPTSGDRRQRRYDSGAQEGGGSRGRGRHPPGLRGREIGLWYARQNTGRAEAKDKEERNEVLMEQDQRENIVRLLSDIKSDRNDQNVPPCDESNGPHSSRVNWFDSEPEASMHDNKSRPGTSKISNRSETRTRADQSVESIGGEDPDLEETGYSFTDIIKQWSDEDFLDIKEEPTDQSNESVSSHRNPFLDEELLEDFENKQDNPEYKRMLGFRKKLPSYKMRYDIVDLINKNQVVVLSGETGCGKTTQVPQYILDEFLERGKGSECHIVCTQPRRISAISVAQRVADERAERLGNSVGYMIRLENTLPRERGSILYCTTGILLRKLETDKLLTSTTHIILDEIHERDLLSDFLIIILKDLIAKRPDLKVVLMSATLNAEAFSEYFNDCPMINVPGFTFPVKEYLMEDVLELLRYNLPSDMVKRQQSWRSRKRQSEVEVLHEERLQPWLRDLYAADKYSEKTLNILEDMDMSRIDLNLIRDLIKHIVTQKQDGAILVFVPGWAEIGNLNKLLLEDRMFSSSSFRIIPLHSMLPTINQREVFERPPVGVRKIVIATNIAETSITIDDIVYVIDAGKIKVKGFSPENNLMSLESEMVSLANAKQRRGRAGRVQAGECFHLFTALQRSLMMDYLPPEILRTPLEELCLQIKNALDEEENLLPLGKHLARMPLDPHTGKMILFASMFGCLDPILTIAASLNFKDPFFTPLGKEAEVDRAKAYLAEGCLSDHILLVKTYQKWIAAEKRGNYGFCNQNFLSKSTLQMLKKMRKQLQDLLCEIGFLNSRNLSAANQNSDNMALVKCIVCAGLYPNVGKIKKLKTKRSNMKFTLRDQSRCELHPKSVTGEVKRPNTQWMVYHKKMKTTAVFVYDCSLVNPYSLLFFGGNIQESVDDTGNIVTVDNWIKFKATKKTVYLVKDLRRELDTILDEKISKTHSVNWDRGTKQGALIQAIIDLVTTETEYLEDNNFSD